MVDILDLVDVRELRNEVQKKYRDVAEKPDATYHFHTGRQHAIRLGYDQAILDQLPDQACEAFAGMLTSGQESGGILVVRISLVGHEVLSL